MVVTIMSAVEQAERCRLLARTNETSQEAKLKGYGAMEFDRQLSIARSSGYKNFTKSFII